MTTITNLPDGALVLSSSTTRTDLPDGSTRIEETVEFQNPDGSTSTCSTTKVVRSEGSSKQQSIPFAPAYPVAPDETKTSLPEVTPVPAKNTTNVSPSSNPETIRVVLDCDQNFNAVIEYYGSRAGTVTNSNVAYVATSELPFPVFHGSDRVLAFVKANVEAYASAAYMYSAEAWAIRGECEKEVSRKSCMISAGSVLMFFAGMAIFIPGIISSTECNSYSRRRSRDEDESCSSAGAVFGGIVAVVGLAAMMLGGALDGGTTSVFVGRSGLTGKGTSKLICTKLKKDWPGKGKLNKYSLELAPASGV